MAAGGVSSGIGDKCSRMGGTVAKVISAKMRAALVEAGASEATAEDAAADVGELAGEVRANTNRLNVLIALVLLVLASLFQIALRLD